MQPMQKQPVEVNIFDLSYPIYIAPIPKGATRIINIPGQYEYQHLEEIRSYVIEAYKTEDKIFIFDVIPYHLWRKEICRISYEKRLRFLRQLVTAQITKFDKVIDLDSVLIDNPHELSDYCDALLTGGYEAVRLMDVNGNYVFGECKNCEYLEMELK